MGRFYTASDKIASFSTAGDIAQIVAPTDATLRIYSVEISQSTTEVDDSTEIRISRFVTDGLGGGSITANPVEKGYAAFGGTILEANSTAATGTETNHLNRGISMLAGFSKIWLPEFRPSVSPGDNFVVKTVGNITAVTLNWEIEFEAIGG